MSNIIDAHSHYMPPEVAQKTAFFKVGWSDAEHQLKSMDENGIRKALLLYPTSDAHLSMGFQTLCHSYNQSISSVVSEHEDRFVGSGILPLDNERALLEELKSLGDIGLRIISLPSSYNGKFLDDELFAPIFEYAQSQSMIVHVHPQIINPIGEERVRDPLLSPALEYLFDVSMCIGKMMMEGTFLKYPDIDFIFAHYGGILPFVKERFDNTYQMLRKRNFVKDLCQLPSEYFKNLYFDTSGSKSPAALMCALEITDAKHILFGSDYPANQNISQSISVIQESSIPDEEKNLILSNNMLE